MPLFGDAQNLVPLIVGGIVAVIIIFVAVLWRREVKAPEVYTEQGVPIMVDGVAQIKVQGTDVAIRNASERFLGMTRQEIGNIALQTLEGPLRAILGTRA